MKSLVYLAWFASACALAVGQQNKTPAAAVSGLSPADVAAIRAASKSYTDLALARDWPNWIKLFSQDAIYLPPYETAKHGPRDIEAWANALPALKTLVVEPLEFTGGGGLAVVRGRYSSTTSGAGQPDVPDSGKYLEVWRKQSDGAWKLFRDIWNSDLPLPVTAAAPAATESHDAIKRAITTAVNAGFDFAAARDPQSFTMFSTSPEVRFATEGTAPTISEFRKEWDDAVSRLSRQHLTDREHSIQVLSPDIAISTTRAKYSNVDTNGATSDSVPFAFTAVWQRQPGGWRIVNAHQSVMGGWPATAVAPADPWLGSWVLNLAETRINPGPAPKGETRTYTLTANGERATYDEIQADGKRVYSTSTYRFDGQDARVVGDPDSHTQAITRTSPRSIASVIKKDGKVVRTATREVSADGKTLTVEFKGTNAKGQPIVEEKWVFDRREEPWLGAWETNLAKSRISPHAIPKFDLRTFTPTAQGEHAAYVFIESDGKPVYSQCDIRYDGSDQPVVAGEPGETLAFTRAGPRALAFTSKRNGRVFSTGTRAVAEDGKTLTVTVKQVDTSGGRTDEVWVLERRSDSQSPEDVAAAVKTAVAQHWSAINGNDSATVGRQHTSDITLFLADAAPRLAPNSPAWLGILQKWQGSKSSWTLRDLEVQPLGSNAAAASFYMDGSIRWADGSSDSRPRRVTEIWINDSGTWKEAHHHDSVFAANPRPAATQ